MIHYRVYQIPPPFPLVSHMNSVYASHRISLRSIIILYSYLRLGLPRCPFPSTLSTKIAYAFLVSTIRSTYPHLLFLDLITLIIRGEDMKLLIMQYFPASHHFLPLSSRMGKYEYICVLSISTVSVPVTSEMCYM
jgi:hypothetical protein